MGIDRDGRREGRHRGRGRCHRQALSRPPRRLLRISLPSLADNRGSAAAARIGMLSWAVRYLVVAVAVAALFAMLQGQGSDLLELAARDAGGDGAERRARHAPADRDYEADAEAEAYYETDAADDAEADGYDTDAVDDTEAEAEADYDTAEAEAEAEEVEADDDGAGD